MTALATRFLSNQAFAVADALPDIVGLLPKVIRRGIAPDRRPASPTQRVQWLPPSYFGTFRMQEMQEIPFGVCYENESGV
jgi:hypothetical protein